MQLPAMFQNAAPQKTPAGNRWRILTDVPYARLLAGGIIALVILIGYVRSLTSGSKTPLELAVLASLISAVAIVAIDMKERYGTTYMRLGFHAGIFIFLTSYPILAPESLPSIDQNTRFTAGIALVLCVLGFEIGYWTLRSILGIPRTKSPFILVANNYTWVHRLLFAGIAMYLLSFIYSVAISGRSFYSVFFTLRGTMFIDTQESMITPNANADNIAQLFSYGRYMAAAAATILILAPNPFRFTSSKTIAWLTLMACAFIGMNGASGGSRSNFMLGSVPLLTTLWIYSGTINAVKQFRPVLVVFLLFILVFGMQYMSANRDMGIVYEGQNLFRVDKVDITDTDALTAFYIYIDYEFVIGEFLDKKVELQNGESLVPIVLGWVPRRFWPDKPYPFSRIASQSRGYALYTTSLSSVTTSIASGLPSEGYGNFGLFGALLWGALMGLGCALTDSRLHNLRPGHPLALAMRGMMAVWAAIIVRGGTAEMFWGGAFPVAFMWVCLYFSEPRQLKTT